MGFLLQKEYTIVVHMSQILFPLDETCYDSKQIELSRANKPPVSILPETFMYTYGYTLFLMSFINKLIRERERVELV